MGLILEDIIVLNNIVDYPIIKNVQKEDKVKLLFLGEIGQRKGVFDIIEVLGKNREYFKDKIILKIGGNKEVQKLIKKLEDYKLSDFVKFEGWISGENPLAKLTDILILL